MMFTQLQIRIDTERKAKLEQIAADQGISMSEWVREKIDMEYGRIFPDVV